MSPNTLFWRGPDTVSATHSPNVPHPNHTSNALCFQSALGTNCPHTVSWSLVPNPVVALLVPSQ